MPRVEGSREIYVAPEGKPDAVGSRAAPLDIVTVFTKPGAVMPGDVVWFQSGEYKPGPIEQNPRVCGTKERPIIFRAAPGLPAEAGVPAKEGQRATIESNLTINGSYTWLWGLELTGQGKNFGVDVRGGDGVKLINLVVHDNATPMKPGEKKRETGQGVNGWDVGNDHEYYGNLSYRNGTIDWSHCIYVQNTAAHSTKYCTDNIVFDSFGYGFHVFGESPTLKGIVLEGNIVFGAVGGSNILAGGMKPISDLVLRNNCTYNLEGWGKASYGVNVAYNPKVGAHDILIEGNYFAGNKFALGARGISHNLTVRRNTFWAWGDTVEVLHPPDATRRNLAWDDNTYIGNGKFDLAAWQKQTGFDAHSTLVDGMAGKPTGLHVVKRVNKYEPSRVHLAVYNWDHHPSVKINVSDIAPPGTKYRIVNVLDLYGKPVAEGIVSGGTIELPMSGHQFEPEFGAYLLFREATGN